MDNSPVKYIPNKLILVNFTANTNVSPSKPDANIFTI